MLSARCQARKQPASHAELVEYFLDTEGEEMNFEVARCRPMITEDFMTHLSTAISERRTPVTCFRLACHMRWYCAPAAIFLPCAVSVLHTEDAFSNVRYKDRRCRAPQRRSSNLCYRVAEMHHRAARRL